MNDLIKALLINAAYEGAVAVCDFAGQGSVPIDPTIADTNLQAKGVMVYEEAKVQYNAILRAFQDKTGVWPDPKVGSAVSVGLPGVEGLGDKLSPILPKLLPLLSAIPAVGPFVPLISQVLGVNTPAVAKPIVPGADLGTAASTAPKP